MAFLVSVLISVLIRYIFNQIYTFEIWADILIHTLVEWKQVKHTKNPKWYYGITQHKSNDLHTYNHYYEATKMKTMVKINKLPV